MIILAEKKNRELKHPYKYTLTVQTHFPYIEIVRRKDFTRLLPRGINKIHIDDRDHFLDIKMVSDINMQYGKNILITCIS